MDADEHDVDPRAKEGSMSGVSSVSTGGSDAYELARAQAAAQQSQTKPPATNDPDHDGDTDAPGKVDVKG
jgi:hypothetical protein